MSSYTMHTIIACSSPVLLLHRNCCHYGFGLLKTDVGHSIYSFVRSFVIVGFVYFGHVLTTICCDDDEEEMQLQR